MPWKICCPSESAELSPLKRCKGDGKVDLASSFLGAPPPLPVLGMPAWLSWQLGLAAWHSLAKSILLLCFMFGGLPPHRSCMKWIAHEDCRIGIHSAGIVWAWRKTVLRL